MAVDSVGQAESSSSAAEVFVLKSDQEALQRLKHSLQSFGYEVRAFRDTDHFLRATQRRCPSAIVIGDLIDSGATIDAIDGLRRGRRCTAPILVLSSNATVSAVVRAIKCGADDFIEMPAQPETIAARLEELARPPSRSRGEPIMIGMLTPREREVLDLVVEGAPSKEIARALDLSPRTVEVHRSRIMRKMKARNVAELVRMAARAAA